MRPQLYFDKMKDVRDWGFVEYSPPQNSANFARFDLTILDNLDADDLARLLESEIVVWLDRFPTIPIMGCAFDVADNLIDLGSVRPDSFIYAWNEGAQAELTWDQSAFSTYTDAHPLDFDLRTIFPLVHCRTDAEVKQAAALQFGKIRTRNRILRWGFLVWIAIIPAAWTVIEYLGPEWLGAIVTVYSLWESFKAGRKALGYKKPTKAEEAKAETERKKDHYFYHCERNPGGFTRLMCENIEEDAKQRTLQQVRELRLTIPPQPPLT